MLSILLAVPSCFKTSFTHFYIIIIVIYSRQAMEKLHALHTSTRIYTISRLKMASYIVETSGAGKGRLPKVRIDCLYQRIMHDLKQTGFM